MNKTRKDVLKNVVKFFFGLALLALGTHLIIQAGIGVSAWECLNLGVSKTLGIKYGNASLLISITVILLDIIMKERIGLGTVLNGIFCGKIVDLYIALDICPAITNRLWLSLILVLVGMVFEALGVIYYMSPSLGCGPRDTFKVGIGRRLRKIKIGTVGIGINMVVLFVGWLLGGPVGIGTVLIIVSYGFIENFINGIMKFEPRDLKHQDIMQSLRILFAGKE